MPAKMRASNVRRSSARIFHFNLFRVNPSASSWRKRRHQSFFFCFRGSFLVQKKLIFRKKNVAQKEPQGRKRVNFNK
jgi:hypothetical protein